MSLFLLTAIFSLTLVDGGYGRRIVLQAKGTFLDSTPLDNNQRGGNRITDKAIYACCSLIRGGKKAKNENEGRKSITKGFVVFYQCNTLYFAFLSLFCALNSRKEDESTKKEEVEEEEEEEEEEEGEGEGDATVARNSVPLMSALSSLWSKTPPISQVYLLSSIVLTVSTFILNKNKWPDFLLFDWKAILFGFQYWRLFTAFLFFGPLDLFYPLTLQFVWQHMSQLEKLNYNKPEEFLLMLLFGGVTLITIYSLLGISMKFLGHNLATFLVYIWSRVFEGLDVNFMDIINLRAEMIPWFFCAQTYLLEKEIPFADLIGIVVGHLYHYLREKKKLRAPQFIKKLFESDEMKQKYAKFKDDFE